MGYVEDRAGLRGKVALVAGGGGGLGRASTLHLARAGVRVAACDKDEALLAESEAMVREAGGEIVTAVLDVRDAGALTAFFGAADAAFGRLDVLVNVVGGTFHQAFADSRPKGWEALIRTNFSWLLTSVQQAIPRLRAAGGGSIVNFTSIEAHRACPDRAVYAGAKAAVVNFTRSIAIELAPDGIRANCIAADLVPTEGIVNISPTNPHTPWGDDPVRLLAARTAIPMGRRGTYDDVGGAVLFLASDLSAYVTGQSLHPDGGTMASSGWFNFPDGGWSVVPSLGVVHRILDDLDAGGPPAV